MIYIQTEKAQKILLGLEESLSKKELAQAIARAINYSLMRGRTVARQEVKKVYNISQKNLDGINVHRASSVFLQGDIFTSRKPIPLDAFAPKQETSSGSIHISKKGQQNIRTFKKAKNNPIAGVSIEVERGHREIIPFAFMIAGGAVRVFARGEYKQGTDHGFIQRHVRVQKSGSDVPVKPLITMSVFGQVINKHVIGNIDTKIKAIYPPRLVHEAQNIIRQAAAKAANP